mmetsp:Transcript_3998/g.12897  ORF Transcript_3998/g.12897 Transcript_3998/m.12897 type:complete len:213 (-) Transcript_3998:517-1155(-)
MPSELFEDASVHAIMDAAVAAFRGPRALQRCYWWVVIRCWLWVVIASLLAISSAGIGLSSRGKKWPLAPTPGAMSDTIGFTTRDGVERISNIWPWPWSPTRRPAAEDRHSLSLLDTSVLPPPPPPLPPPPLLSTTRIPARSSAAAARGAVTSPPAPSAGLSAEKVGTPASPPTRAAAGPEASSSSLRPPSARAAEVVVLLSAARPAAVDAEP